MQKFRNTQINYDRLSRFYDLIEGWGESSICSVAMDILAVQQGEKVLEIGSGTGANLLKIIKSENTFDLVGMDLSLKMCYQAMLKLKRKTHSGTAVLVNGNAIQLPFPQNHFDAVFMLFTLEIIPAELIQDALSECQRVLKLNGRICIAAMAAEKMNSLMMRLLLWSTRIFPKVIDCHPINLEVMMKKAGFRPIDNQSRPLWGLPVRIILADKHLRSIR